MRHREFLFFTIIIFIVLTVTGCSTATRETSGDRGPEIVTGNVTYTNYFFTEGVAEPVVILEDQGGFVTRDRKFVIPVESQVIAKITSDFYTSPFTYSLSLPATPNGTLNDVDHDGSKDTGVMVFAVAYWTNTWGDPYLERRDQSGGGWSSAYASTKVTDDRDAYLEVYGGKYLVYAPDDGQQFPSGFGDDHTLFTDDDPIMDLDAGWSVIDLDRIPFAVDRSETPTLDLYEPESAAMVDLSQFSYTEAYDKMVEKFRNEYAFTELKKIDWEAKEKELRPGFERAEKDKDPHAYALALRDFLWSIPDAHVGFDTDLLNDDFQVETAGGLGFAIRETDDGKVIANFITPGGAAQQAGMEWGAEILSFEGTPIEAVIDSTIPWSSPFSNPEIKKLQQLRYATRFPLDKGQVEISFINPGGTEQNAMLPVTQEGASFASASFRAGQSPTALPVEFDVMPSGYGYIKVSSFLDNDVLSILVWERAIEYFKDNGVPGIILDMRINGGGSGWLADQMAAYFINEETVVGNTARYDKGSGEFYMDEGDEALMIPPRPDLQYDGPVVVMVGPACASACEFFSYDMTINNRATVVGQYSTDGAGGSVEDFKMPEDITVQITIGRAVDAEGNIHLEGRGVVPHVKVPVTFETLQRQSNGEDVILQAAVEVISKPAAAGMTPSGSPKLGSSGEAEAALASGAPFLEDLANENHESAAFSTPGSVPYTISITDPESLIWGYVWCAADADTLAQNFDNIQLGFTLNERDIQEGGFAIHEIESGGRVCRLIYATLSDWPAGEHHLRTKTTFTTAINDGSVDYPPGDYVLDYTVYVNP